MKNGSKDRETMKELLAQSLTIEEMLYYAESEYVDEFYYSISSGFNVAEGFEIYDTDNFGENGLESTRGGRTVSDITMIGYSSHDAMIPFMDGENVISEGSVFEQGTTEGFCVISYEFSTLNEVTVGDVITVCNPQNEERKYDLKICGIFQNENTDSYVNTIFTTYEFVDEIVKDSELRANTIGTYVFSNVEKYELFCLDVEKMGLDTGRYIISSNDINKYEKSILPLESLSKFTMLFLVVVLVIGGGILIIFNMFTVRERKYEIGVLAAIGMKKGKIAIQFLVETFLVTVIAIILGSGIGVAVSQPVGDYLLQEQIESIETEEITLNENFGGKFQGNRGNVFGNMQKNINQSSVEYLDNLDTTTDLSVLLTLMGISILLTLAASSAGMISVLRYEPLKILSER